MPTHASPCGPLIVGSTCDALERLVSLCSTCVCVDRGHMHTDGRYEVALRLSESSPTASTLTMPRFLFQHVAPAPVFNPITVPRRPPRVASGLNAPAPAFRPASGASSSSTAANAAHVEPPLLRSVLASVSPTSSLAPAAARLRPVPEEIVSSRDALRPSQSVILVGLTRRADLNGRLGTVLDYDPGHLGVVCGIRVGDFTSSVPRANMFPI